MSRVSLEEPVSISTPEGPTWLSCSSEPLDLALASQWVITPECGAMVVFAGTVRDHAEGRTGVTLLDYEAYEEHVVPTLKTVATAVRSRWPNVGRVVLWHRTGPVSLTELAVVVAVSTPHRDAAFEAARWAIDEVKATAPIWKSEHHDGGVSWGRCDHRAESRIDAEAVAP